MPYQLTENFPSVGYVGKRCKVGSSIIPLFRLSLMSSAATRQPAHDRRHGFFCPHVGPTMIPGRDELKVALKIK